MHSTQRDPNDSLLAYDVPTDIRVWRQAVYAALLEDHIDFFYVHIHTDERFHQPGDQYTHRYSWGLAKNSGFNHNNPIPKGLWRKFHQALIVCEMIRPATLRPSKALTNILEKEGYFT